MSFSFSKDLFSRNRAALFVVGIAAIVIYSNTLFNPFVFDDRSCIVDNAGIRDLCSFFSQGRLFTEPRAIVELTFALNYKIGGFHVFGYHLFNILIHVLNGFLVYFLVLSVLKLRPDLLRFPNPSVFKMPEDKIRAISLFAALIFVAHPIQTQAVTYTVQRYASMGALFYMGSMLFYAHARFVRSCGKRKTERVTGPGIYYGLSILFGILAFLSKQNTASLPGAIVLLEYLLVKPTWKEWKWKLPWFALMFVLWFVLIAALSGLFSVEPRGGSLLEDVPLALQETEAVGWWQYLCTQFNVLVIYMRLLFLPINQNLDYMYPFKTGFFDGLTPFAFFFLCVVAGIGAWNVKRRPVITFSIFFFFITLSIESSFIPISDALFEHRLYLPTFGFGFLVAYALSAILSHRPSLYLFFSVLVVIGFGTATYRRNVIWQDSFVLWADVLSKAPHNYRAHNNLGNIMMDKGEVDKAIQYYSDALKLKQRYWVTHNNLGIALVSRSQLRGAITCFENALKLKPDYGDACYNLAKALSMQGRLKEAERYYLDALRLSPDDFEAHNNLAVLLVKQGKIRDARAHFMEAIRIKPDFKSAVENLKKVALENTKSRSTNTIKVNDGQRTDR